MYDSSRKTNVVLVRRKIKNLEKSYLWYAALQNGPLELQLIQPLRQPFMSFKEGRETLARCLGVDPMRLSFQAFKGSRTFFPDDIQFQMLTEVNPNPPPPAPVGTWRTA